MPDDPAIIQLTWIDSTELHGWHKGFAEPVVITTIGYLIHETETYLSIAHSLGDNDLILSPLTIPKGCILTLRELSKRKEPNIMAKTIAKTKKKVAAKTTKSSKKTSK